jgi:hypothetical protein
MSSGSRGAIPPLSFSTHTHTRTHTTDGIMGRDSKCRDKYSTCDMSRGGKGENERVGSFCQRQTRAVTMAKRAASEAKY